ncbi:MAG: ABC transporter ATP-binding protein [Thermoleophilaceae bacterium]
MSLLELSDVAVSFGGVHAVKGVTAGVEAGSVTALIGPNGAGKTTLMNMASGVTRPDRGAIRFRGQDVTRWAAHRIARLGMARTFQNIELFRDMTVRENVLAGRHARMSAGLLAAALRLPRHFADERDGRRFVSELLGRLGLDEVADEPATSLPYGLERRAELARALASEPALLLLDEPMAGLSREESEEVGATIRALVGGGLTVLLVEHEMETVMALSDRVLVLDHGTLLAEGAPGQIQSDEAVIAAYLGEEEL